MGKASAFPGVVYPAALYAVQGGEIQPRPVAQGSVAKIRLDDSSLQLIERRSRMEIGGAGELYRKGQWDDAGRTRKSGPA